MMGGAREGKAGPEGVGGVKEGRVEPEIGVWPEDEGRAREELGVAVTG